MADLQPASPALGASFPPAEAAGALLQPSTSAGPRSHAAIALVNRCGVADVVSDDQTSLLFAEAVRRHQQGQRIEAIVIYRRILSSKPNLPEVHSNLGAALAELRKLDEAESSLRRAIRLKPDYPEPHVNLGMMLKATGRLDEAETMLRRATKLKPRCPETRCKLGVVLRDAGKLDKAEAAFRRSIALKPHASTAAYVHLALILKDLHKPDEAEAACRQAIAVEPQSAELRATLGTVLMSLGRGADAMAAFRQAIALKPDFPYAYNTLGMALRSLGALEEAEPMIRRAIALQPDFAEAHNNLGNIQFDQGRLTEAVVSYRLALALRPNLAEAHNNLGLTFKELGRLGEALQATEQAIRLTPRRPAYFRNLGELRRFVPGEPHLAALEDLARTAATLSVRDRIELHFALAKAYEDVGRPERSFHQLLTGNALKRRHTAYDEGTILEGLKRVESVFTPELIRRRHNVGDPCPLPVFIVGMMRSGTTLVEQILASHPQVFGAGEVKHLGNALADIRSSDGGAGQYPDIASDMSDEQFRDLGARYLSAVKRLAPDAARIVNKMPANFIYAGLIHLALPNAAIIHTVRDPVDTCMSCFSKLFTEEQNHTYDLAELGRFYRHYQTLMAHWHRVLPPGRILDIRYEDVVADLEGSARRIVFHCGLEWDPRCLDFHRTERPVRTASASQVRQPIYTAAVGRSRRFAPFLAPLLAELGQADA